MQRGMSVLGRDNAEVLHRLLVEGIQGFQGRNNVAHQNLTSRARKVLADDDTQHLEMLQLGGHGVGGHDPAALAETGRNVKLVIMVGCVQAESNQGKTLALAGAQDREAARRFETFREVIGGRSQVRHDLLKAGATETDQHIVLADDLAGALAKVEGERGLIAAKVVDVKDQILGQVLGATPESPANAGVGQTVFVAGHVDRVHTLQTEVPLQARIDKGRDETTTEFKDTK